MIELSFSADLYDEAAVRAAASAYARVATSVVESGASHHVVRLTSLGRVAEGRIADELGNFALGTMVEERRAPAARKAGS